MGVAAGGLDDGGTGNKDALFLGIFDHGQGDAVLDAAAGIEILHLGQDTGALALKGTDFYQGRTPDQFC